MPSKILYCHPGSLNAFALKLRSKDTLESLQSKVARKLALVGDGEDIAVEYLWCDVYYPLVDAEDWALFLERHRDSAEVDVLVNSPAIPTHNPSLASVSSLPSSPTGVSAAASVASGRGPPGPRSIRSATTQRSRSVLSARSGRSGRSERSTHVPEHTIKFEEFHNQLGVRTLIGAIGPVSGVRMLLKPGHRACYMSRAFALKHSFIPRDAAPGFYGFAGITNLGAWPITVGAKTVVQDVMLVEQSFFPVILGRAFMERRGVRIDPLDPTAVVFMDTSEVIPTELVIVKDAKGQVIPIS